jgi:hypothetical protein
MVVQFRTDLLWCSMRPGFARRVELPARPASRPSRRRGKGRRSTVQPVHRLSACPVACAARDRLVSGNGRRPIATTWACANPSTCSQDSDGHLGKHANVRSRRRGRQFHKGRVPFVRDHASGIARHHGSGVAPAYTAAAQNNTANRFWRRSIWRRLRRPVPAPSRRASCGFMPPPVLASIIWRRSSRGTASASPRL